MSARMKTMIMEYTCDWCGQTEERSNEAARFVSPIGWYRIQLPERVGVSEMVPRMSEQILCPTCASAHSEALTAARVNRALKGKR